jgi:hypothetical protein
VGVPLAGRSRTVETCVSGWRGREREGRGGEGKRGTGVQWAHPGRVGRGVWASGPPWRQQRQRQRQWCTLLCARRRPSPAPSAAAGAGAAAAGVGAGQAGPQQGQATGPWWPFLGSGPWGTWTRSEATFSARGVWMDLGWDWRGGEWMDLNSPRHRTGCMGL